MHEGNMRCAPNYLTQRFFVSGTCIYICTNLLLDAVFSLSHTYVLGVIKNVGRKKSRKFIGPVDTRERERKRALLPENLHALLVRGGGKA